MNVSDQRQLIAAELADLHTCLPGEVVSYDGEFAVVRPTLAKQLANGDVLPAPKIVRVPVLWPCADIGGLKAMLSMPLKAGDQVLLHFCERAIEDWLGGQDGAPGDPRQFDLSDAFATPLPRPGRGMKADPTNVSISFGSASLKLTPGGALEIVAPAGVQMTTPLLLVSGNISSGEGGTGTVTIDGSLSVSGEVSAGGVGLTTHHHQEHDGPNTGPALP